MTIAETLRRTVFRLRGKVLHFPPEGNTRGTALISYITLPYFDRSERTLNAHSNRWESMEMVRAFTDCGYGVDLIDITNQVFVPKKRYDFFVDNYHNMERLAPLLGPDCIKIFHATTAHWKFNNEAEQERFDDLYKRRGVRLAPDRALPSNRAIEVCDIATMLGNDFTAGTYAYAGKEIVRIPISTTHMFPSPEQKDFEKARKHFIWFGGAGVIHKGLDLVVEAFAQLPEYRLTICGKIEGEEGFLKAYAQELALPNITIEGFLDPGSMRFKEICASAVGLIYPSCSEGQVGSVVLSMHAGLIPVISRESGVDLPPFGSILKSNTVEAIKEAVGGLASAPVQKLREHAMATWRHAQRTYTRARFSKTYREFVAMISGRHQL